MSNVIKISKKTTQYCGFKLGDGHYAIPVNMVQEVVKPLMVTPIPLSPDHVRGLMNLRGQIVTAISLRKLFGMPEDLTAPHMNIIVRNGDALNSLVVDEIQDVIDVPEGETVKAPETVSPKLKDYIDCVYKTEKHLIILLKVDDILSF